MTLPWYSHSTVEMDKIREHGITIQRPFRPRRHYRYSSTYQSKHTPLFLHFPLFLHPYLRTTIVSKVILFMRRKIFIFGSILPEFISSSSKNVLLRVPVYFFRVVVERESSKACTIQCSTPSPLHSREMNLFMYLLSRVRRCFYICATTSHIWCFTDQ